MANVQQLRELLDDGELVLFSRNHPTPMIIACNGINHIHIEFFDGEVIYRPNWAGKCRLSGQHTEINTPMMRERVIK